MRLRFAVLIGLLLGHTFGLLLLPRQALAASGGIYISELQTGGAATGHTNDEFIELYNATANDVALKGWKLEYRPVSSTYGADCTKGWSKSLALDAATIKSHKFLLIKDSNYPLDADMSFANWSISGTAGAVRILDAAGKTADALAWGDDPGCGFGRPASIGAGQSLERLPGAQAPQGGNAYDTGDNANDFLVRQAPEPQKSTVPAELPLQFTNIAHDSTAQLELSEVSVNPAPGSSAGPFLEFHNTGTSALVLSSYLIKLGVVGYYLPQRVLLPDAYAIVQSETFPLSLDTNGGVASLIDAFGNTVDGASWPVAPAGASRIWAENGWVWTARPTPAAPNEFVALPEPAPAPPATGPAGQGEGPAAESALEITELLPDPASPATDAEDEFIEIHNAGAGPADLAGYVLKTGSSLSDSYTLPAGTLDANGYIAFKSSDSHVALANSGSSVALYGPDGRQIGAKISYEPAKSGQAWAKFGGGWSWTTTPTPAAPNVLTQPTVAGAATATVTTAKAKATAKSAAAKSKVAPTKKAAAAKTKAVKTKPAKKTNSPLVAAATTPAGHWLLFVLAGLTIAYIIYEFRYDLRDFYHRLRGYPGRGATPRPVTEGRGGDRASERPGRGQDDLRPGARPRPRLQW
ncbi:MAG: Non specific extracellular endonuclease cleaving [Patescibacteria group bacterium]|nr:Non specific extracellular endonuclease cleaving [Patescibacteria group bacterium]